MGAFEHRLIDLHSIGLKALKRRFKHMKLAIIIVGALYITALIGYRKAYLKRLEEVNNE